MSVNTETDLQAGESCIDVCDCVVNSCLGYGGGRDRVGLSLLLRNSLLHLKLEGGRGGGRGEGGRFKAQLQSVIERAHL